MAYTNGLASYRQTRIKTANPGQQVVMLYDEAIRQLELGLDLLARNGGEKKDPARIEGISRAIIKTQEIITELTVALNFEEGGEIAQNLFSLYTWFNRELLEANIAKDMRRLTVVRNLLKELRGAWGTILTSQAALGKAEYEGINIAG